MIHTWLNAVKAIRKNAPFLSKIYCYVPVGLTLCLGVGLSVASCAIAWKWENNQMKLQFQQQVDNLATTLQRQIDEYSYIALSVSALYAASPEVTPKSYEAFTQHLLWRYSGISTLGWIKPVSAAQRQAYEARMKRSGFPDFYIYEQSPTGEKVKSGWHPGYYPITFSPHREVVGFDINSDPLRKAALEKARDTGKLTVTGRLESLTNHQTSLAMLLAVYHKGAAKEILQTGRQSFYGAIIGVYSLADIIKASLKGVNINHLNFSLYDASAPNTERFLAFYNSQTQQVLADPKDEKLGKKESNRVLCHNPKACQRIIKVADRKWSLRIVPMPEYSGGQSHGMAGVTLLSGLLLTAAMVAYLLRSLRYTADIEAERAKSELLLLNILPHAIAQRLKQKHETIADSFAEVTVLFADIVNFTQLSERIPATELVQLLNEIFSIFDQLSEDHGLEKIKTIGDAYMVVGGLPTPRSDHALAVIEMALGMQQALYQLSSQKGEALSIRIGINTGPVVAGVIGTKKFIYDLWGDTVNTASRMESHGIAGAIQVTSSTYELCRDRYLFEERGVIQVKGKGEMTTYLLTGRKIDTMSHETSDCNGYIPS